MTFIRFTSRIDPTWNGRKSHHTETKRTNVYATRRRDSMTPEDVCAWMNAWAAKTCKTPPKTA